MHRLLRQGSLPGRPFHMLNGVEYVSAWSREAIWWRGTSGIARKIKNTNLIRPHTVASHSGSCVEQVSISTWHA